MIKNQILAQKKLPTDSDEELATNIGETTEVSWIPPENLTYDQWERIGNTLQQLNNSIAFWTGDWLNHGEARYGEKYTQAIRLTGSALETLKKRAAVSKRVPVEIRIPSLTFTHHFYVAYTPENQRGTLLKIADFHGLTSRELRQVTDLPDDERAHLIDL